jgi:hypothetical protein
MKNQSSNPSAELQEALAAIEALLRDKKSPSRYEARALLLPLGALILEGEATGLSVTLGHVGSLIEPHKEEWSVAIADEMGLAGDEFCLSVNADYLKHPRYDFAYAATSREQLEQRIQAAEHLGFPVSEALLARIEESDVIFEPYLEKLDE